MEFPLLLQYLGGLLGMSDLALNENGVLSLKFGASIVINLEPDPDGVRGHIYGSLGPAPADAKERTKLFEALLSANCFARGTGGASFGLDEHAQEILLGRVFNCKHTEPQELFEWLKDMVSVLDIWQGRRAEMLAGTAAANPPAEAEEEFDHLSHHTSHFFRP